MVLISLSVQIYVNLEHFLQTHPQHIVMVDVTRIQSAPKSNYGVALVLSSSHQSAVLLGVSYWRAIRSLCV